MSQSRDYWDEMELEYDPFETEITKSTTAADKALTKIEYGELLDAAAELKPIYDKVARFVILLCGRLGLRRGELAHLDEDWVDFEKELIDIPAHQPCDKGNDGGICGSCLNSAKQMAEVNDVSLESVAQLYWKPKTLKAAREIPYGFDQRIVDIIDWFFSEYDRYPNCGQSINRRINDALEQADGFVQKDTSPHGLRATAATYHAMNGLDTWNLQQFMGWSHPNTAENYVANQPMRTRAALNNIHNKR